MPPAHAQVSPDPNQPSENNTTPHHTTPNRSRSYLQQLLSDGDTDGVLEGSRQRQVLADRSREGFGSECTGRVPVEGVAEDHIADLEVDEYGHAPALRGWWSGSDE